MPVAVQVSTPAEDPDAPPPLMNTSSMVWYALMLMCSVSDVVMAVMHDPSNDVAVSAWGLVLCGAGYVAGLGGVMVAHQVSCSEEPVLFLCLVSDFLSVSLLSL